MTELSEVGGVHSPVYILGYVDVQVIMPAMKSLSSAELARLEEKYQALRKTLASVGYITQGSVLQRNVATSGRSGYQWTRKVSGKTVSVSLSQDQFVAMKEAVQNERKLWKTIKAMEKISRQILFQTTQDTARRKPLQKRVLGLK